MIREQPMPFSHEHHVARPRHRLPLLPHLGRGLALRRHPADQDLHELPLADLDQRRAARAGARRASAPARRCSGRASTTCPTSSTSTTASTCAKGVGCADLPRPGRPHAADVAGTPRCRWSGASTATATRTRYVRPRDEVFNVAWQPPADQTELRRARWSRSTQCSRQHADELLDVPPMSGRRRA